MTQMISMSESEKKVHLRNYNKYLLALLGGVIAFLIGILPFLIYIKSDRAGATLTEHLLFLGAPGLSLLCFFLAWRWFPAGAASHKKLIAAYGVRD